MWILDTWRKDCRTVLSRLRGENANLVNQSVNQSVNQCQCFLHKLGNTDKIYLFFLY